MKIAYCSDLHLEFFLSKLRKNLLTHPKEFDTSQSPFPALTNTENADVLILAGDICNIRQFLSGMYQRFFDDVCSQYKEVIWVYGNHEYYDASITDSIHERIENYISERYTNLYATHRGILEYDGVSFLCGTLWTDFDKANPNAMLNAQMGMADYGCIYKIDSIFHEDSDRLTPSDVLSEHRKTIVMFEDYLSNVLESNSDVSIVCVTHHAPSFKSILPKYLRSSLNASFASELDYLTVITPNLKYWIHGHMHDKMEYKLHGCKVLCNPHGYIDYENTGIFKLEYFEV